MSQPPPTVEPKTSDIFAQLAAWFSKNKWALWLIEFFGALGVIVLLFYVYQKTRPKEAAKK